MIPRKTLPLVLLFAISSPVVFAQCFRVNDTINGNYAETGCIDFCALPSRIEATNLMPGFFTAYEDGKATISGVLPNSPASGVGLRVGDELLEVDNQAVPFVNDASVWQQGQWHTIKFRRGSLVLSKTIKTETVQEIVAGLPAMSNPLKPASFSLKTTSFKPEPFLSGMLVHREGAEFVVDSVLRSSPAEGVGIKPGDRLSGTEAAPSSLQYSNERTELQLTLQSRPGRGKHVTVRFASLAELLDSTAR